MRRRGDDAGVDDPGLELRRRTGRRIILAAGCIAAAGGVVIVFVLFLAVWQFLSPTERTVPTPRTSSPPHAPP
jgi:hypothetical protein